MLPRSLEFSTFSTKCSKWLLDAHGGNLEAAGNAACVVAKMIDRYRETDQLVNLFARFVEGATVTTGALSFFLFVRTAVLLAPLGLEYAVPPMLRRRVFSTQPKETAAASKSGHRHGSGSRERSEGSVMSGGAGGGVRKQGGGSGKSGGGARGVGATSQSYFSGRNGGELKDGLCQYVCFFRSSLVVRTLFRILRFKPRRVPHYAPG